MTASTTRCWPSTASLLRYTLLLLLLPALLWRAAPAMASPGEDIAVLRAAAAVEGGALTVSTRYRITLPASLQGALQQGVPLTFRLSFELTRPRSSAYWLQLKNWFEPTASISFKLVYYQLTNRYRVVIGSLGSNYGSLAEALAAVGSIAGWSVLDVQHWDDADRARLRGRVRLELDIGQLPRPFQLGALASDDWELASPWSTVAIEGQD